MAKTYYLKYDFEAGEIILDSSAKRERVSELLIVRNKITLKQGKMLKKRLELREMQRGRKLFSPEIESEFKKLFHACEKCGYITNRSDVNKAWGDECESCFRETQEEKRKIYQANKDYRKQIRKYKLHLQTLQGKIDSTPISLIELNVRIELKKKGKRFKDMSDYMELKQSYVLNLFSGKTIKKEYLLKMAEFLFIPVEKFLKRPRGYIIPYRDGVPKFWLDENFVIRNYDDPLKGKI